jgi:hypothetical protein
MQIRDRVKDFRRVRASLLRPNPRNWRTHPPAQRDALRAVLAEVGFVGALLARELPDGSLELIDGHLRAETTPDAEVPVLVLDVDAAEAAKLLATFDPLSMMAGTNHELLTELLEDVETKNHALGELLSGLSRRLPEALANAQHGHSDVELKAVFQVVVQCSDEDQQRDVFERLVAEGLKCKLLTL